ncbi:hypothetical protein DPMN_092826 [Dreissena polymorpha]|uniref:Uncharacterized protein n=1 Tax=Dreissena polymorpha TaxID=45954 RepID=A0A9D4L220_DREPO|nr:hypothetical protein DPMN_092826 [Dreissena polymorpha]
MSRHPAEMGSTTSTLAATGCRAESCIIGICWQAESNSSAMFQERNLIHWLHDALRTLRTVIFSTQLTYYMIPERNLMAACGLKEVQQRKWVADITDMIDEGPRMILRLGKIRQAVISYPEPLLWFSARRMEVELLQLELRNGMHRYDGNRNIEIWTRMKLIIFEFCLQFLMLGTVFYHPSDILYRLWM